MDYYSAALTLFVLLCVFAAGLAVLSGLNHLEDDEADEVVGDIPNTPNKE